jgi:hypothetical protein
MPLVPVFDLEYNPVTNLLVAGTHAKSIMSFDLLQEGLRSDIQTAVREMTIREFDVSPNPASDYLQLPELSPPPIRMTIMDVTGKIHQDRTISNSQVNIAGLKPGIYHLYLYARKEISIARFLKM